MQYRMILGVVHVVYKTVQCATSSTADTGILISGNNPNYWGQIVLALISYHSGHGTLVAITKTSNTSVSVTKLAGDDITGTISFSVLSNGNLAVTCASNTGGAYLRLLWSCP